MFAGDGAAGGDAGEHDLRHGLVHAGRRVGIVGVIRNVGVQVAIAGVKHVTDLHAMTRGNLLDGGQHLREPRARYHGILHHQRRRNTTHRAEGFLAALPQAGAIGVGGGHEHVAGAGVIATLADDVHVFVEPLSDAVDFTEQNRSGIGRIAGGIDRCFDGADGGVVHHLERSRYDAGGDDA